MPNMSQNKTAMPVQEPNIRNSNFQEVALGYTAQMAMDEAQRCLSCKNKPCVAGCPVNVDIPAFIKKVADGEFHDAYEIIASTNMLPAVCGRVCPQENQCEKYCIRAKKGDSVGIGRLERFVADTYMNDKSKPQQTSGEKRQSAGKAAVIGSGPAGLTCAGDLARMGYDVTLFEAFHVAGGVLVYGIPEFRLPKRIVAAEIDNLTRLGVQIKTNMIAGKTFTIEELFSEHGFDAVFIGTGAGLPKFMGIEGEQLSGVYSANEFLTRVNLMKAYLDEYDTPVMRHKKVAVVGGGNVAMDAARCAKRLGAHVYLVYRRSEVEMPARLEEVHHAKEEGIQFEILTNPVRILGDENGRVSAIECVRMDLSDPDESGRRRPIERADSNFTLEVDSVIMALGTSPNPLIKNTTKQLETNRRGCLIADENTGATTMDGVFAGGDAVTGAATVILAMGAGKKAAAAIDAYVKNKKGI